MVDTTTIAGIEAATAAKKKTVNDLLKKSRGIDTAADAINNKYYTKTLPKVEKTATLNDDLKATNAAIKELEKQQTALAGVRSSLVDNDASASQLKTLESKEDKIAEEIDALQASRDSIQEALDAQKAETSAKVANATAVNSITQTTSPTLSVTPAPLTTLPVPLLQQPAIAEAREKGSYSESPRTSRPPRNLPLTYNVAVPSSAYFSMNKDYLKETGFRGNRPGVIQLASQLWTSAANSKGMIVMTNPVPNNTPPAGYGTRQQSQGFATYEGREQWVRYGFQFLYNPASVSMGFATAPDTDIALQTSGQEAFNLMGTTGSFSTVSFQIIINRMFDMSYFDKTTGKMSDVGIQQYGSHVPSQQDLSEIYNKGTMYDIEYLMKTLLGYTLNTYLRGNTADIGYLGAFPVELHLGKSMRYWGTIASFNVNHTIFNEKMIPVFSSLDITFNRLVDPPNMATGTSALRGL